MTELVKHSTERSNDAAVYAVSLLHHYGFDLGGYTIAQLLSVWQERYPVAWIRLATIEALYQGRYKAISVEQILALWERRRQPLYHFNHEFERLVCDNLPASLLPSDTSSQNERAPRSIATVDARLPYHSVALQLPSFEGSSLPESDVMFALRTLHSEEMAVLTSQKVAAQNTSNVDQEVSLPAYSYALDLDEQAPSEPTVEASTQREVDSASSPETAEVEQYKETVQQAETETVPHAPIAHTAALSEPEQAPTAEPLTDKAVALDSSASPVPVPIAQTTSIARILQQLDHQALHTKPALPAFGLLAHTLKPNLQLHLTARYQPIWLTEASSKQPIHQFTPNPEQSDFHSKLKAVAQPTEAPEGEQATVPPET